MSKLEKLHELLPEGTYLADFPNGIGGTNTVISFVGSPNESPNDLFNHIRKAVLEVEPCDDCAVDKWLGEEIDKL